MMLEFIIVPFINLLVLVYGYIGENFGLAIILFTIMVRLVTYPLTKNQMKQSAAMQDLQKSKKYEQMQKKYKNDREKLAQEQMKLFQEMGVNPLGSCLPSLLSTVIIIPVYFAVTRVLVSTPLELLQLFHDLNLPNAANFIPLNSQFLWMDLGQPERLYLSFLPNIGIPVLALIVMVTSYMQSKLITPPPASPNDQSAQMGQSMAITMPLMMGYISYSYSAGLALYFVISNLTSIIQYAAMGRMKWENFFPSKK